MELVYLWVEDYKNIKKQGFNFSPHKEDVLRLIACGYMDDESLNKRPLSKLIKDISQELGLS